MPASTYSLETARAGRAPRARRHRAAARQQHGHRRSLKRIASRVDDRAGVISIEASDPVPYVASQPDPRTFVVELRDVVAVGFADNFTVDPRRADFRRCRSRTRSAVDGATVARVSVDARAADPAARAQLAQHDLRRGRSARSRRAAGVIGAAGPSSVDPRHARRAPRLGDRGHAAGHRRLVTTSVEASKEGPARLYVDLPNATSALPGVTPVGTGPVQNVRIGLNDEEPAADARRDRAVAALARTTSSRRPTARS